MNFVTLKNQQRTCLLTLRSFTFQTSDKREIKQRDPDLEKKAQFVTVSYTDQKNGKKIERRTQNRSGKKRFCPVAAWAKACQRVRRSHNNACNETPVCSVRQRGEEPRLITAAMVANALKTTCEQREGKKRFGFDPKDLGTRSL